MIRPTWDEFGMAFAYVAKLRSTCLSRQVGASLLSRDHWVISTGYNGAPAGLSHCEDLGGCLRKELKIPSGQRLDICRATHAEQNVIIRAALYGCSTKHTTLYVTVFPCITCAKMIVNARIEHVVWDAEYENEESKKIFVQGGTGLRKFHGRNLRELLKVIK